MLTATEQRWTALQLQKATGGRLVCGDTRTPINAVVIDSRKVRPDVLFVAIRGENHDGHQFALAAVDQGASAILVDEAGLSELPVKDRAGRNVACIAVDDTVTALGAFAAWHRQIIDPKVVAITGSNGKTTTRRMTAAVLRQQFETHDTHGNFNNEIGLPLTLLELEPSHQWAAIELGMNHFGEISRLAKISRPDIGVITNIAACHLEGVGDLNGVLKAKTELLDGMTSDAPLLINGDDPRLGDWGQRSDRKPFFWGESEGCRIRAQNVHQKENRLQFELSLDDDRIAVTLQTPGRLMVQNALAAAGVGWLAGIPIELIAVGLETFHSKPGRLQILTTEMGVTVIDDTYNANPGSMAQAIDTLTTQAPEQKAIAVLGDMLELGPESDRYHRQIGALVAQRGVALLCATGHWATNMAEGALNAGLTVDQVFVGTKIQIVEKLINTVAPKQWVLFKGSRGMAMETALTPFIQWANTEKEK